MKIDIAFARYRLITDFELFYRYVFFVRHAHENPKNLHTPSRFPLYFGALLFYNSFVVNTIFSLRHKQVGGGYYRVFLSYNKNLLSPRFLQAGLLFIFLFVGDALGKPVKSPTPPPRIGLTKIILLLTVRRLHVGLINI